MIYHHDRKFRPDLSPTILFSSRHNSSTANLYRRDRASYVWIGMSLLGWVAATLGAIAAWYLPIYIFRLDVLQNAQYGAIAVVAIIVISGITNDSIAMVRFTRKSSRTNAASCSKHNFRSDDMAISCVTIH